MKKHLIIWLLIIAIVFSSVPLCVSAVDYSDVYAAYLSILKSNQTQITQFQKWQESWTSDHERGVVLCDICGDETPELMFCTVEENCLSRLRIYTYEQGRAKEIYNDILERQVAGGSRFCLFQTAGDKSLCMYYSMGDEFWSYTYTRYAYSGGKLVPETKYKHYREPDYYYQNTLHEYTCNDSTISSSYYLSKTNAMLNSMSTVFFTAMLDYDDKAVLQKSNASEHLAITVETAISFLNGSKKVPFVDTVDSAYYAAAVKWAAKEGITTGVNATCFAPDRICTRAQVVTFLWRACGSPMPKNKRNPFTDVKSGQYYSNAVLWAIEKGITNGVTATQFCPDRACTRGEVVTFLWRAKGTPTPSGRSNPFSDVGSSYYYYQPVLWAVSQGITTGTTSTAFAPEQICTRAQIVTFLYRAYH